MLKMDSEKFCLRWNDFEKNISFAFQELRDDKDFFDVTLACDDEQIQAHKVILSACSPFFRNILRRNPHQNPLLYLKGVKFPDLQSVLNFMYHGEVNVAQGDLNSFLAVAEDLQVKGLTQNQPAKYDTNQDFKTPPSSNQDKKYTLPQPQPHISHVPAQVSKKPKNHCTEFDDIEEIIPVKSEPRDTSFPIPVTPATQPLYHAEHNPSTVLAPVDDQSMAYPEDSYEDYSQYDEPEQGYLSVSTARQGREGLLGVDTQSFQDPSELLQFVQKDEQDQKYHCTLCGKFSHKWSSCTRNHVESKHFPTTFCYPCNECEMVFNTKTTFNLHRSKMHTAKNK